MKKIIIIVLFAQSFLSCAQTIFPLNTPEPTNGSYIKDIDNELDPYVGTWEGTWNNKKITLYLIKITHVSQDALIVSGSYYEDLIIGKYRIVDLNTGTTLEDTTGISNVEDATIISSSLARTKNMLRTLYMKRGVNAGDCKILSDVLLYRDLNNPNILTYKYYVDSYNYDNCPYTNIDDIPVNIPKQEVVLHKL